MVDATGGRDVVGGGAGRGEQLATLLGMVQQIQAQNEQQLIDGRELRGQIAQLIATLPEAYVPRREVEGRLAAQQRQIDDLDKRQVATEEWRIAQTRADGQRLAEFAAELERVRGGANDKAAQAAQQAAAQQQQHTSVVMNWLVGALSSGVILLAGYILANLHK